MNQSRSRLQRQTQRLSEINLKCQKVSIQSAKAASLKTTLNKSFKNYWSSLSPSFKAIKPCRNKKLKSFFSRALYLSRQTRVQIHFSSCKCCVVRGWCSLTSAQVLRSRSVITERWIFFCLCEVFSLVGWFDINKMQNWIMNWISLPLKMDGFAIKPDLHL